MPRPAQRPVRRRVRDPVGSAAAAGLRYVSEHGPGIRRRRAGRGFTYLRPDGVRLADPAELSRIRKLAIPPAWTAVWICPDGRGHLQASGRDQRGRKQYRYHPRWREVRDQVKYHRMVAFARALPRIRRAVHRDLSREGLDRERVLAVVVRLLETTLIRVGNEEYARDNKSFGLTTLRNRHVAVSGDRLRFRYRGKSGRQHVVGLQDRHLSRILRDCQELPGQELFQYLDGDGRRRSVKSEDVNGYLRAISGRDFTAKDFRTWAGTVRAAWALKTMGACRGRTQARRNVVLAVSSVATRLGNTPAISRKCYIHPRVIDSYLEGTLPERLPERPRRSRETLRRGLYPRERAVLAFLVEPAAPVRA